MRRLRNRVIRELSASVPPEQLTAAQARARAELMRARGERAEAQSFLRAWLAAGKSQQ